MAFSPGGLVPYILLDFLLDQVLVLFDLVPYHSLLFSAAAYMPGVLGEHPYCTAACVLVYLVT